MDYILDHKTKENAWGFNAPENFLRPSGNF